MKYAKNRWYVVLLLVLAGLAACDENATEPVNEAQILVEYAEANRDYDVHGGFIMSAADVRTNIVTAPDDYYVIDIRAASDFAAGHVPGAVHVALGSLPDHMASMSPAPSTYEKVILVCYTGQTAAYGAGALRALGYENVFSMKFGMSAWHSDFAGPWNGNVSNQRATQFESTASPAKNDPGALPELNTGFEDGASILEARLEQVFADGFSPAVITNDDVFMNLDDYHIINYWPQNLYDDLGHIPGAINYPPSTTPFLMATELTTLPTDKPVVVYCYTGQGSAYLAAYLRMLGYDARTLVFGANAMIYDALVSAGASPWTEGAIMNYDYEVSN